MTLPGLSAPIDQILTSLALLERNIIDPVSEKPAKAYDNVPYTISAVDMPLFVNFVKGVNRNQLDGSDDRGREFMDTRQYDLILYHSPFGSGLNEEMIGLLTPWFDLVYAEFMQWPHLQAMDGVIDALITGDSGAGVQSFVGQQYYGIRFTMQVTRHTRWLLGEDD